MVLVRAGVPPCSQADVATFAAIMTRQCDANIDNITNNKPVNQNDTNVAATLAASFKPWPSPSLIMSLSCGASVANNDNVVNIDNDIR